MPAETLDAFAICHPGLESVTLGELRALRLDAGETTAGGVAFRGSSEEVMLANLHLRTATRILVRLGSFRATAFWELEKRARGLAWERFLGRSTAVRFRVSCRKSKLYHSDAVAERMAEAVGQATGAWVASGAAASDEDEAPDADDPSAGSGQAAQLVVVRLVHDRCSVSVDASGALLHRRGYRQAVGKAPLRETMAAALLMASGWDGGAPLMDPMCGSGTIPIEGALMARRIAPGIRREFAFMRWPGFDEAAWQRLTSEARGRELPASPVAILGSDRDAGAVAAAIANAERAGVAGDVRFERRAISTVEPPEGVGEPGWLVGNPPYGKRVGEEGDVRDFYAALGGVARARLAGWTLALLSPDPALDRQVGVPLEERARTSNGGIPVRVVVGRVT